MPVYEKGLIYKLIHKEDYDNKNIYIGSTTNFTRRKCQHKTVCNNPNDNNYNALKYEFIRQNGGWDMWDMILIESYSCNNKKELESRERYWVEHFKATLNKQIPTRTQKEYCQYNKENYKQYHKQYYQNNQEQLSENHKEYYQENKEKISEYKKQYYENNKQKIICECGCEVSKYYLLTHQQSNKHINLMKN